MIDELTEAIVAYQASWQRLVNQRTTAAFFNDLKPTCVGWKVADLADFDRRFTQLRDASEQVHLGWVEGRWLATFCLSQMLPMEIRVVKLVQRRPESTDAIGLDSLDFLLPQGVDIMRVLQQETDLTWTEKRKNDRFKWISIWFDDTEAKLRHDTVLDVCALQLQNRARKLSD